MVKSASRRSTHYDKKIDGDVINFRITQQKGMMVEQTGILYPQQVFNESKVKDYLEHIGMYGIDQHHYMNYAQELWSLSRTFTGQTLRFEAEIKADKWLRRGLNATHLIRIAALFGVELTI